MGKTGWNDKGKCNHLESSDVTWRKLINYTFLS